MKKYSFILIILGLGGLVSFYGYLKKKELTDNERQALATIIEADEVTGDRNVPRVKKPINSYNILYEYEVDGQILKSSSIITKEDIEYGFPIKFKIGTRLPIIFNKKNPADNRLKCKLKRTEDKIENDSIKLELLR